MTQNHGGKREGAGRKNAAKTILAQTMGRFKQTTRKSHRIFTKPFLNKG